VPELPEVETVRRQLARQIVGDRIVHTWARLPRITKPSVREFVAETEGHKILDACRRGKQLYFPLDSGAYLLVHLGMTGRLFVEAPTKKKFDPEALHKHIHAVLVLNDTRRLVFADPRTFGSLEVTEELKFLSKMGPEPLDDDFDGDAIVEKLAKRSVKIKAALLDQALVAGIGNIYADEICFLARVHPEQRANDISKAKLREIVGLIRPVLERAVAARGATLKDGGYQDTFGIHGEYHPHAYGRTGEPCENCGTAIQRGTLGPGKSARSYHFCPKCQPLKKARGSHS
jgi:formamidopyrimidine-DNA glycosylase